MSTTATLVIDYGSDDTAFLVAELDTDRNNDKSSFQIGDTVFFKVYHSGAYTVEASSGSVTSIEIDETKVIEGETISFVQSKTVGVSKKCIGITNTIWQDAGGGNNYGTIAPVDHNMVAADGADNNSLGMAKIDYTTEYDVWAINCPVGAPADYAILILIKAGS